MDEDTDKCLWVRKWPDTSTCGNSQIYCASNWANDMKECCPDTCERMDLYNDPEKPMTEDTDECLIAKGFSSTSTCDKL